VTFHEVEKLPDGQLHAGVQPLISPGAHNSVALLRVMPDNVDELVASLQRCTVCPSLAFSFTGLSDPRKVVAKLVNANAWHEEGSQLPVDSSEEGALATLQEMQDRGLAVLLGSEGRCSRWQLTAAARDLLKVCFPLEAPQPVFQVREHVPLDEHTSWELLQDLVVHGWQCLMAPKKQVERASLVPFYPAGQQGEAPKNFYAHGLSIDKQYLISLHRASELFDDGVAMIRHCQSHKYYQDLLERKHDGSHEMRSAVVPRKRRRELLPDMEPHWEARSLVYLCQRSDQRINK